MSSQVNLQRCALFCIFLGIFCKSGSCSYVNFMNINDNNNGQDTAESEKDLDFVPRSAEQTASCNQVTGSPSGASGGPSSSGSGGGSPNSGSSSNASNRNETLHDTAEDKSQSIAMAKLYDLVQHIYAAQGRVQLEANEIKKAQAVSEAAQKTLDEAAIKVRVITAALESAQQEVSAAAIRAQTAQLQLAAHDQLLFTARQNVDALSSQMVGLQAEGGVTSAKNQINIQKLLKQLNEPLNPKETPTPIPAIDKTPAQQDGKMDDISREEAKELSEYEDMDRQLSY